TTAVFRGDAMTKARWLARPDGVDTAALQVWRRYASKLHAAGRLTIDNAESFAALCRLIAAARAASAEIEKYGITIGTGTGSRRANPAIAALLQVQKAMEPLQDKFGLDELAIGASLSVFR